MYVRMYVFWVLGIRVYWWLRKVALVGGRASKGDDRGQPRGRLLLRRQANVFKKNKKSWNFTLHSKYIRALTYGSIVFPAPQFFWLCAGYSWESTVSAKRVCGDSGRVRTCGCRKVLISCAAPGTLLHTGASRVCEHLGCGWRPLRLKFGKVSTLVR
jgi:hypothetical protein